MSDQIIKDRSTGRLVGYGGVVWIQGDGWETSPGWMGPLKVWHARRYARRNGITLIETDRSRGRERVRGAARRASCNPSMRRSGPARGGFR